MKAPFIRSTVMHYCSGRRWKITPALTTRALGQDLPRRDTDDHTPCAFCVRRRQGCRPSLLRCNWIDPNFLCERQHVGIHDRFVAVCTSGALDP